MALDPPLAPEDPCDAELLRLQASVATFVRQARAAATRKAYTGDWNAFSAWCAAHSEMPLPTSQVTLALYLAQLAELGRKYSSIKRARIAIGQVHAAVGSRVLIAIHGSACSSAASVDRSARSARVPSAPKANEAPSHQLPMAETGSRDAGPKSQPPDARWDTFTLG